MEEIYDTNDSFQFDKLVLSKPILITGGNYFIRCLVNNAPFYIQPPKCTTKQGILKAGKKFYTDLMFTNENEHFIRWMENLEAHCQQYIYKNREKWFDGDMDLHDIENYFTSPLKIYKSGKFYIARTNVASVLGKPTLKIYDENETEIDFETINDKTNVMTILEIQGIRCSARSFQIDLEIKQIMTLKPSNLFTKCIIKPDSNIKLDMTEQSVMPTLAEQASNSNDNVELFRELDETPTDFSEHLPTEVLENQNINGSEHLAVINSGALAYETENIQIKQEHMNDIPTENVVNPEYSTNPPHSTVPIKNVENGLEEIEFHLEELPTENVIQLKKRNDVYYEMYKEARRKAKIARDLALTSYLEAKRIKNTYLLNDNESDDSDENSESDLEEMDEDMDDLQK